MCDKSQSFGRRGRTSTEVRRNISELWLVFDNTLNTLQFHQNTTLQLYNVYNKCIGDDTKAVTRPNPNCIKKTKQNKIKYGEKRFSTLPMELLNPAMWHVALGSWHWIRQVAAPCTVAGGSGMTWDGIRPNVRHIGILHLVSILTISPQSTCHSVPVCEILSKSDQLQQKKITSCRFSRWRISAILDFRGPIMGSLKSPCTTSYR